MKRQMVFCVALTFVLTLACREIASSANSVVIESKTVAPGATSVTVGVYFTNDVCINGITAPLEIRTTYGGAFMLANQSQAAGGRLASASLTINRKDDEESSNSCSGPTSKTWTTGSAVDYDGRTAVRWNIGIAGAGLSAGSDGSPGSGTPSMTMSFDVNCEEGTFEIDTCCFASTHSNFSPCGTGLIVPVFTKGVITLDPGVSACTCNDNPADVNCDGVIDIIDYVTVYNVAFRGYPEPPGCCYGAGGTASWPPPVGGHDDQ